jgi:hypothetical protein
MSCLILKISGPIHLIGPPLYWWLLCRCPNQAKLNFLSETHMRLLRHLHPLCTDWSKPGPSHPAPSPSTTFPIFFCDMGKHKKPLGVNRNVTQASVLYSRTHSGSLKKWFELSSIRWGHGKAQLCMAVSCQVYLTQRARCTSALFVICTVS